MDHVDAAAIVRDCTNTVLLRVAVAVAVAIIVPYTAVSIRFNSMHSNFIDPLLVAVIK